MKRIIFAFIGVFILFTGSFAHSLGSTPLDSLFTTSRFVGIVTIKSGIVGNHGWAIYKAEVNEVYKGDTSCKEIRFGFFRGYFVGSQYLLFLDAEDKTHEPDSIVRAELVSHENEILGSTYEITWEGFGSMKIDYTISLHDYGVKIACDYIIPPSTIATVPILSEEDKLWNYRWIKKSDMVQHLKYLRSIKNH